MLDGVAFVEAQKEAGAKLEGARVLQLGAGSAGSAISVAFLNAGIRELILHDVDTAKADGLAQLLAHRGRVFSGPPDSTGCDIVINTTPMGMDPEDPLPVPAEMLHRSMFVGDVVAGHGKTALLQAAQAAGSKTSDGSGMVDAGLDLMLEFLLGKQ